MFHQLFCHKLEYSCLPSHFHLAKVNLGIPCRLISSLEPVRVHGKELELVVSAKLLGITITSDLSGNTHVNDVIKKAAKRLYFLVQLKRAKDLCNDLGLFYITCVRSVLDYAIPVFIIHSQSV